MSTVHIVLPDGIDDPANPSGGNVYDRRICGGLTASGWTVREHPIRDLGLLKHALAALPDDAIVLIDGLIASEVPEVLVPESRRLRLVVLMHMPLGDERERAVLSAAIAVVTTSIWSRERVLELYSLPAGRVHAAPPGVDAAPLASGSVTGSRLLCVAAVAPHKGQDLLVRALARIPGLSWNCECVGPLDRDPAFADALRRQAEASGIADRVSFAGPHTGPGLDVRYAAADLLVLPSRGETYGMVVTEALARGIPVLATAVGGVPEALGRAPDGSLPGILVPPGDPAALAGALRHWLAEPELRHRLKRSARDRRVTLAGWALTSARVANVLSGASASVGVG